MSNMIVDLIAYTPDAERVVASAAKLCYSKVGVAELSEKMSDEQVTSFLDRLADLGHGSPWEHASFTFAIEGVSRSLTHQLVRHRLASYSQQSQRYVREGNFKFIVPEAFKDGDVLEHMFQSSMRLAIESYSELTDSLIMKRIDEDYPGYVSEIENSLKDDDNRGVIETTLKKFKEEHRKDYFKYEKYAIENARAVLPNAAETKIMVTMNARELHHFFRVRTCERAQDEIRELATRMYKLVYSKFPTLFKNAGPACVVDGVCPEGNMSCGEIKEVKEKFQSIKDAINKK